MFGNIQGPFNGAPSVVPQQNGNGHLATRQAAQQLFPPLSREVSSAWHSQTITQCFAQGNFLAALGWARLGIQQGFLDCYWFLGEIYLQNKTLLTQDEAFDSLKFAFLEGHLQAQKALVKSLISGEIEPGGGNILGFLKSAIDKDIKCAEELLIDLFLEGKFWQIGNYTAAIGLLRASCFCENPRVKHILEYDRLHRQGYRHYLSAVSFFRGGDFISATRQLKKAVDGGFDHAKNDYDQFQKLLLERGLLFCFGNESVSVNYMSALEDFKEIEEKDGSILYLIGFCNQKIGKIDLAISHYTQAVNRGYPGSFVELFWIYRYGPEENRDISKSEDFFRQLFLHHLDFVKTMAHGGDGRSSFLLGKYYISELAEEKLYSHAAFWSSQAIALGIEQAKETHDFCLGEIAKQNISASDQQRRLVSDAFEEEVLRRMHGICYDEELEGMMVSVEGLKEVDKKE